MRMPNPKNQTLGGVTLLIRIAINSDLETKENLREIFDFKEQI